MKRILIVFAAIFGFTLTSLAHPVDLQTAQSIASKFMGTNHVQLSTTYTIDRNVAAFYVFNTNKGFIIVCADDCETPIIGYSHEGRFDPYNVPVQMEDYLQDFVARIQYGIENHIVADETTARQWELVKSTGRLNNRKDTKAVEPLLTEKWHQGCLYNSLCPSFAKVPCGHAEVGCVAVAMGQIMHYWGYPATGWGSHSYYNQGVVLFADFGNATYDWAHMPDSLTESSSSTEIEAVATLLYHCGVSVNMEYGTNGSNASSVKVPNALMRNFDYSRHMHRDKKGNNNDEWLTKLKDCLDLQRPIYYSGSGSAGGHAFVCDGYDDNDLLHFNWGWGGNGDGYFALGNLSPIGYSFNNNNYAIFDIYPEYEPCVVTATAYPSTAGTIEGSGEYHIGDSCTLTATPAENYEFYYWKKDGQVISNASSVTIGVEEDTLNIEAHFSCFPVGQISANYSPDANNPCSPDVSLSWNHADTEWKLLKQFDINEELGGLATDGEHIYVTYGEWNNPPFLFGKYTMEGELVEKFNVEGAPRAVCLAYDGTSFYCNSGHSALKMLYRVDLDNKTIIDSTNMGIWFGTLTYDPEYDGFWLGLNNQTTLYDRQGQFIKASPTMPDYIYGTGYLIANEGNPHLLISRESGVYDYDISNNYFSDQPLLTIGEENNESAGTCIGKYDGKDALFIDFNNTVYIYAINRNFSQIAGYRIYRANVEGDTLMLADEVTGASYVDLTWNAASAGEYRFGISEVYANGVESDIIWSDTIVKSGIGIEENNDNQQVPEQPVQKVFEDGQIIIIKDGKRYNVTGQRMK